MKTLNKIFQTVQIPAIDKYTVEHEPISSLELMERAAGIWTQYFLTIFGECQKVAVVAGNGNNGGDGYVIARLLSKCKMEVIVFRLMTSGGMSVDCERNYRRWQEMGGKVIEITKEEDFEVTGEVIIVDALFGSGLNRKVTGIAGEVIRKMNRIYNPIVAVDMPSGLMGEDNSSNDRETIVRANYTFTFQFPKLAFMLPENSCYVGEWEVLDIGLNSEMIEQLDTPWYYTTMDEVKALLPLPDKYAHKGTNGRGLLIAGSKGMMGAAILAAKAALRSGIGLLYCHVPEKQSDLIQITVPEALLDVDESKYRFSGVKELSKYDAIAIGPGIGKGPETVMGLRSLLQDWKGITILDADALNIIAEHRELLDTLHPLCILTPHVKEFERLAGKSENDFDRLNKLSIFASQFQVYIILKGAHSAVATPDGSLYFNMSGNPGMAKGGSGDVLTGVLLGLAANRINTLEVARIGAFAHGYSADLLALEYGYRGITAGMIAEGMGKAWKNLELKHETIND